MLRSLLALTALLTTLALPAGASASAGCDAEVHASAGSVSGAVDVVHLTDVGGLTAFGTAPGWSVASAHVVLAPSSEGGVSIGGQQLLTDLGATGILGGDTFTLCLTGPEKDAPVAVSSNLVAADQAVRWQPV